MNRFKKYTIFIAGVIILSLLSISSFAQNKGKYRVNFLGDTVRNRSYVAPPSGLSPEQELLRIIGSKFPTPTINYNPDATPKFWTIGLLDEIGFSQVSLSNWAAGGEGSVALNAYVNAMANYEKGKMYWDNRLQLGYGFVQSFDVGYRKSDDRIVFDSKWGYRAYKKFYFSAALNFKTQFSPGFDYDKNNNKKRKSGFLAPGYGTLGIGVDYKPGAGKVLILSFYPLTGGVTIVRADSALRVKYGNEYDKMVRWQIGAQFSATFQKEIVKNLKVASQFSVFSDYMGKPDNLIINWDVQIDYKINKYFRGALRTNLIYNDKVKITTKSGREVARVQFKEIFSLNFSYTIGEFKK